MQDVEPRVERAAHYTQTLYPRLDPQEHQTLHLNLNHFNTPACARAALQERFQDSTANVCGALPTFPKRALLCSVQTRRARDRERVADSN